MVGAGLGALLATAGHGKGISVVVSIVSAPSGWQCGHVDEVVRMRRPKQRG